MVKRRRSDERNSIPKRLRVNSTQHIDRITSLSDEILIRVLHNLPLPTLLLIQTLSKQFQRLALDSELWKSLYYDRFVLPRALRIPGMRTTLPPQFSSSKSKWLDDVDLVRKGKETNWKRQYRLRHNWARGTCAVQEIDVEGEVNIPGMLVKLAEGLVFTVDYDQGLRIWSLREKKCIVGCQVDGMPTCLALDETTAGRIAATIGFQDGSWGVWQMDIQERSLNIVYRHPASSTGKLAAIAYSSPYVLTITNSQLLSLYTFTPAQEQAGVEKRIDTNLSRKTCAPCLLASLKSHTSWPPLSLSIRTTSSTLIASIAYSLPTYLSGYTVGLQELHLDLSSAEITFSRLTSALQQGFHSLLSPTPSSPSSGTSTPTTFPPHQALSRPTSLSYSHPYILATHSDNTLTLYLCTSTASSLSITPGTKLWGHTSSVSSAQITPRGKAVSVSTRGNELRVWELEGGFSTPSRKRALDAGVTGSSVRIRPDDGESDAVTVVERWREDSEANKRWVGFDDETVIVLKEGGNGGQALMVYDFT